MAGSMEHREKQLAADSRQREHFGFLILCLAPVSCLLDSEFFILNILSCISADVMTVENVKTPYFLEKDRRKHTDG